jgi:predicted GNAT family acetyltransferase
VGAVPYQMTPSQLNPTSPKPLDARSIRVHTSSMAHPDNYLDNPIWNSLTTQHSNIALGNELARAYPKDIAPFAGVAANTEAAFDGLATLVKPSGTLALLNTHPALGEQWTLVRQIPLTQMVYAGPAISAVGTPYAIAPLSLADVPAMLALVDLTHPGPFLPRTIELGTYLAVWQDGQLAAMAGERMHVPGHREISAVCTRPDFQRRGYARQLVLQLIHEIQRADEIPFLHVATANTGAQTLYESMGFKPRAEFSMSVIKRQ